KYYDAVYSRKVRRTMGRIDVAGKVAVYLIYPTYGLQMSHLRGIEYLISKGYAPVVVSNLPLSAHDRDRLVDLCHICLERPNFGYDFGGYRDGILAMAAKLSKLDHLLIINDSTWFALPGCRDWLCDAEALNVDFAAAASNYGVPRARVEDLRDFVWDYRTTHKNFHYCSFALLFSKSVLTHPDFHRYWKTFPLTNKKNRTVRRGEIGLSKWIIWNGFTHGVTCDIAKLDEALEALDENRLRQIVEDLIVPEDTRLLRLKHDLLKGDHDRRDLILLILHTVARQGSSYALASYMIKERGFPCLKKSPVWLNREASDTTMRLAAELPGPAATEILSEMQALRADRAPDFDQPT
ncbi:MAG: rhamnan synthesis F family protein, partial [Albidovulum sp.]|uniref:rhamnan synthesis F family protein n=1 Tax=Albidovulum sp. TaxID=1872424 RepID=UPI003C86B3CE